MCNLGNQQRVRRMAAFALRRRTAASAIWLVLTLAGGIRAGAEGKLNYTDLRTDDYLGEVQVLATVEDTAVFTEGPAVDRKGRVYFSNVPVSKTLVWDPATKRLSVFREKTNQTNGMLFDPQGRLLMCEGMPGRLTRLDLATGAIDVLAERFNGLPVPSPNDLCQDTQGRIWPPQDPQHERDARHASWNSRDFPRGAIAGLSRNAGRHGHQLHVRR